MKYTISNFLFDVNSRIVIRPAQAAMVEVNINNASKRAYIDSVNNSHAPVKLFAGFRFADGSFDAITCGYGVRNFAQLDQSLAEMYRVLRPGGQLRILEFTYPTNPIIR